MEAKFSIGQGVIAHCPATNKPPREAIILDIECEGHEPLYYLNITSSWWSECFLTAMTPAQAMASMGIHDKPPYHRSSKINWRQA